jgi:predicted neuraminidase
MGLRPTNGDESAQGPVMLSAAKHLLFFTLRSRFSGFWSPMPRSERDSEDSTGVPKSDFVATLLRMTGRK